MGLALSLLLTSLVPCGMAESTNASESKTLVAYFSCTGNTKRVAEYIADEIGADLFEIQPEEPYTSEDLIWSDDTSRSSREHADVDARPAIAVAVENIDQYDRVFIGYPSWWGEAPRIVSTFVESYDFSGKTIIPFCTSGSTSLGSSAELLSALCSEDASWLDGERFPSNVSQDVALTWLAGLELK